MIITQEVCICLCHHIMSNAAKKSLVKKIIHKNSIYISFVVYSATSDVHHYIILSPAVSFIPMATTRLLILITTS